MPSCLCPFLTELQARQGCFFLGGRGVLHFPLITPVVPAFRQGRNEGPKKVGIHPTSFLHSDQYKQSLGGSSLFQPPRGETGFTQPLSSSTTLASSAAPASSPHQAA